MRPYRCVQFRDRAGEWRWKLVAPNGRSVACSGEGYTRKRDMEIGCRTAAEHMPSAEIVVLDFVPGIADDGERWEVGKESL